MSEQEQLDVFYKSDEDQIMNWAMEKARLTLGYFKESLLKPQPEQRSFAIKARIVDGDDTEHIWLSEVTFDQDGLYYGAVNNHPVHVKNVQIGSRVGIAPEDVSDWMLIENGRLIGGYTIRVYRDGLEAEATAQFDQQMGMQIDYGVDYFPHDMQTPEGAILCLEDCYTRGDLQGAMACKNFEAEAALMLQQIPGMGDHPELLQSTAETLALSFEQHFAEHGMPSFEGVQRAFPSREFLSENTVVITEICYHPDGNLTMDRLVVIRKGDEWRVGPPANDTED